MNLTIEDIEALVESTDVECKAAQGRDGKGQIPKSIWETYCAMANTSGGYIYLGIEETEDHRFIPRGIKDIQKMQKQFWDIVNNKSTINKNLLTHSDVDVVKIGNMDILHIHVPRAQRNERPIHLGKTPFGNTYLRRHEGDYLADDESVRRMIAEAVEESRDDRILENFGIDDLDIETVNAYRNRYSAIKPDSPWLELPLDQFLVQIGAMGKDRQSGKTWLRCAGLLMFGRYTTIKEQYPYYMVDYQERPEPKTEFRWIDRVIPDGTWSGNLYDFYRKVMNKLTSDLKVPFQLQSETRIDDTPIHRALREALTNALIHADYTGRVSVLVVKRPDLFGFRNPGLMRVSVEQAMSGGISDCRNHRIQDMFRYIGLGDHAGSGIPSILKSWRSQHWRTPLLYEDRVHEQTLLELRTSSLLPEESISSLQKMFGERFNNLSELQRVALVTADTEGLISHTRLKSLCVEHPKDVSAVLTGLVKDGFLEKQGETRAAIYYIRGTHPQWLFSQELMTGSPDLSASFPDLSPSSPDLATVLHNALQQIGYSAMPGKLSAEKMRLLITTVCTNRWLTLLELSRLLQRESKSLQEQYLTPMVAEGTVQLRFPESRNHPGQAYGVFHD